MMETKQSVAGTRLHYLPKLVTNDAVIHPLPDHQDIAVLELEHPITGGKRYGSPARH